MRYSSFVLGKELYRMDTGEKWFMRTGEAKYCQQSLQEIQS